jgi:hypothetical protein
MKLINQDGSFFALDAVGYQYPDIQDDYWESNWLVIQIQLQLLEQSWSIKDPCLTTFELQILLDWLHRFSINAPGNNSLGFTESYVQFEFIIDYNRGQSLRINYRLPPNGRNNSWKDNISIDFPLRRVPFNALVEDLQAQLTKFPQRVFRNRIWIAISGLDEDQVEISLTKLKEDFDHSAQIRMSVLNWDSERGLLIARIVHDYSRETGKEAAREIIRESAISALNFAKKVSLKIFDQPV